MTPNTDPMITPIGLLVTEEKEDKSSNQGFHVSAGACAYWLCSNYHANLEFPAANIHKINKNHIYNMESVSIT